MMDYQKEKNGYKIISLNLKDCTEKSTVFNPFLFATDKAKTLDEKEIELRKLLDTEFGPGYAKQRLRDISFLDNELKWKERAIRILREYANKL